MAWRQDGKVAVLTCTQKSPVRNPVLTRFLTIRELENGRFAYASGRENYRPDGTLKVENILTETDAVLTEDWKMHTKGQRVRTGNPPS